MQFSFQAPMALPNPSALTTHGLAQLELVQDSFHSVIRGCVGKGLRLMWHRWFLERSPVEVLSVSITCQVVGQPTGGPACVSRSSAGREVRGASHSQPQAIAEMTGVSAHRFSDAAGCTSVASSGAAISFAMRV